MNKTQFLKELSKNLRNLPAEDREDALIYYTEFISDMGVTDSDDVTEKLGTPKEVAAEIVASCVDKRLKTGTKSGNMAAVKIVLGSLFVKPAAATLLVLMVAAILAAGLSAVLCGVCVVAAGVACVPGILWAIGTAQKLVIFGFMLLLAALGIIIIMLTVKLVGLGFKGVAVFARKAFRRKKVS